MDEAAFPAPAPISTSALERTRRAVSPRFTKPPTPLPSLLIHGTVFTIWLLLLAIAFLSHGILSWSVGIIYIIYDTALLIFTFVKTLPLRTTIAAPPPTHRRPSVTAIITAYNEAAVLIATIEALRRQSEPPEQIFIADDGSTDTTSAVLQAYCNTPAPALGEITPANPPGAQLRWLAMPHAGKATTLNAALTHVTTELFITVDADTILLPGAIAAMRDAFAADENLVAATGVLTPVCNATFDGRVLEWFQSYEYVRNFLSRYAWMRMNGLLLISGAFAGFRRDAVLSVGGFDADCMVEDYELIHRLRRAGYDRGLGWHTAVLGGALGRTAAPSTLAKFLRQRRRWFGGFLQTQNWYRDMAGARRYGEVGLWMLPVKAADTMQPIYGLSAFILLLWYIVTGQLYLLIPVGGIIIAKIIIDLGFHAWSIYLYRKWVGGHTRVNFGLAILAAIIEPFSFQLFRHLGASWGWVSFLTGHSSW